MPVQGGALGGGHVAEEIDDGIPAGGLDGVVVEVGGDGGDGHIAHLAVEPDERPAPGDDDRQDQAYGGPE